MQSLIRLLEPRVLQRELARFIADCEAFRPYMKILIEWQRCTLYQRTGRVRHARQEFRRLGRSAGSMGAPLLALKTRMAETAFLLLEGRQNEAVTLSGRLLEKARLADSPFLAASALICRAEAKETMNNFRGAADDLREAGRAAGSLSSDQSGKARLLLAQAFLNDEQYDRALKEALPLSNSKNLFQRSGALVIAGRSARGAGKLGRAAYYLKSAYGLFREIGDHANCAVTLENRGVTLYQSGRLRAALLEFDRACSEADRWGIEWFCAKSELRRCTVLRVMGRLASAREALGKAARGGLARLGTTPLYLISKGLLALSEGQPELALQDAAALSGLPCDNEQSVGRLALAGEALIALNRPGEAARPLREAADSAESVPPYEDNRHRPSVLLGLALSLCGERTKGLDILQSSQRSAAEAPFPLVAAEAGLYRGELLADEAPKKAWKLLEDTRRLSSRAGARPLQRRAERALLRLNLP